MHGEDEDAVNPAAMPQPAPTGNGAPVLDLVIADLQARSEMGERKYGTVLRTGNGRDALMDAYQESLDQSMYLRQLIEERTDLREQLRLEREANTELRSCIRYVLASASPSRKDNPTMYAAWGRAMAVLGESR